MHFGHRAIAPLLQIVVGEEARYGVQLGALDGVESTSSLGTLTASGTPLVHHAGEAGITLHILRKRWLID